MSLTIFLAICVLGLDFMIFVLFQWLYGEKNRNRFRRSSGHRQTTHSQTPLYYVSSRGNSQGSTARADWHAIPGGRASCINQTAEFRGSNIVIAAITRVSPRPLLVDMHEAAGKSRKKFLQGLKPDENTQFTSALKHRPPKEKDPFRSLMHDGSVSRAALYRLCANPQVCWPCIAKKLSAASPCFSMRVRLNCPDSGKAKFQRCSTITIAPVRTNSDPPRKRNTRAYSSASA
jgi:hypothetical protein